MAASRRVLRAAIGLAVVIALAWALATRVRAIVREPRVALSARVVQLMYNRTVAAHVVEYARRYGRPPYYLDSVLVHLDSAERARVAALRTDLWGRPLRYRWSWCDFSVSSDASGWRPARTPAADDADWRERLRHGRMAGASDVWEPYLWPAGVGRSWDCGGGPVGQLPVRSAAR